MINSIKSFFKYATKYTQTLIFASVLEKTNILYKLARTLGGRRRDLGFLFVYLFIYLFIQLFI